MSEIKNRVQSCAKKASSVKHTRQIAYIVKHSELLELNKTIEIKENVSPV